MKRTGNPVLSAIVSSARFAGRRLSSRFSRAPEIDTLIVDVDRTITREDSPKIALEALCGRERAKKIFDSILKNAMLGRIPLESIHSEIFGQIYRGGFHRSDWAILMSEQERSGGLRIGLIEAITRLAARERMTLILATRSSRDTAEWLARRYGFDYALGSEEKSIDGTFMGFASMIGVSDGLLDGIPMRTKMSAASMLLAQSGRQLEPERTAVLTNDLLDTFEMLDSACGILFVPREQNTLEKLTLGFRLYDEIVREDGDIAHQLALALNFGRN